MLSEQSPRHVQHAAVLPLGISFPFENSLFHDCDNAEAAASCSHHHQLTASLPPAGSLLTLGSQAARRRDYTVEQLIQ